MTFEDFARLVRDELGLVLTDEELSADLDRIADWDSMQLLRLVGVLERRTGRRVPIGTQLEARSLAAIHTVVATP
jgi:acyl carrier protein